ncbi:MAG TPA: flagellar protein FlgN [Bacillota bacterium]|nr:flagellar protein FlgN [Bacillota bacterium]
MSEGQLPTILCQVTELLEQLNELSLLKKEALLKDDLGQLEEVIRQEETLLREFKTLDAACLAQVQFFLQEQSEADLPAKLKQQLIKVRQLSGQLQVNNQFNLDLIGDALALTQFTLNALTVPAEQKVSTYNGSGKVVGNNQKNHLLDFKG